MLHHALRLLALGWSIIPVVEHGKRPLVSWREFQTRLPTAHEVETWFAANPDANIGVVTGDVSGLVVLDVERRGLDALRELVVPATTISRTQGGGRHYFFRYGHAHRSTTWSVDGRHLGDVRAHGGIIVLPPSQGCLGSYSWVRSPWESALAVAPLWLAELSRGGTAARLPVVPPRSAADSQPKVAHSSRSERDAAVAFAAIAAGVPPDEVIRRIAAGDAAVDRGIYGPAYAARTVANAAKWAVETIHEMQTVSVGITRRLVNFRFASGRHDARLILDRAETNRSKQRWEALALAFGFDVRSDPRRTLGRYVKIELIASGHGQRVGRVFRPCE